MGPMPVISRAEAQMLKEYVTAPDKGGLNQAESTVMMQISHSNLKQKFIEIRLDMHSTIEAVKVKLSFHSGTSPSAMVLQLLDEDGKMLTTLNDDSRKLGFYSPRNGYIIHIIDTDPGSLSANGWLEDTSLVQKYVMSDADYDKREKSYRKWKDEKIAGDPTWTIEKEMAGRRGQEYVPPAPKITDEDHLKADAEAVPEGARCSVEPGDRRGTVKYVGRVEGLPAGYWVGVHYDEPLGKNDGSTAAGKRYFECPAGYGAFVRPDKLKVGDFPAIDEFASDDEI